MKHTYRKRKSLGLSLTAFCVSAVIALSLWVGTAWGWFSASAGAGMDNIQAAVFKATVEVKKGTETVSLNDQGRYPLEAGGTYTLSFSLDQSSTASTGYCKVMSTAGLVSHSDPLTSETTTVTLVVQNSPAEVWVEPTWGTYVENKNPRVALLSLTESKTEDICLKDGMILTTDGQVLDKLPLFGIIPRYEALFEYEMPVIFQNDYPDNRYGPGTIASDGCGVVSLAMLAQAMTGHTYSVTDLAHWFGGQRASNVERFELGATTLGLPWEKAENIDTALAALKDEHKIVVMLMDGFETENPFTTSQHFLVLRGLTTDGRFLISDSNRQNYGKWELKTGFEEGFTKDQLVPGYGGAWIFDPAAVSKEDYVPYVKEEPAWRENFPGLTLTEEEQTLIAKVIWVEAQGECAEGQQAIAEVILNRLTSGKFGSTVESVVYAENQFRSVPYLKDATPWQAQYDALDAALYSEPVLPRDVFYFATEAKTNHVWGQIGGHIFCYENTAIEPTEPTETEPVVTEPTETQPVETQPTETQPTEPQPTETEPTETKPTETKPTAPTEPTQEATESTETGIQEQSEPETIHDIEPLYQSDKAGADMASLAMTASYLSGHDYTPETLADWFGGEGEDEIARLDNAAKTLRLPCEQTEDMEDAAAAVADGKILILRLEATEEQGSVFTEGVHYIVVRGITEDGKFLVCDPSRENADREELRDGYENGFAAEDVFSACTHAWIFDPEGLGENFIPYTR